MANPISYFLRALKWSCAALVLLLLALGGAGYGLSHMALPMAGDQIDFVVDEGASLRTIAQRVQSAGVTLPPAALVAYARITGADRRIKAGGYQLERGDSLATLVSRMARGDMSQREITLVEGWNFRQIRAALRRHPDVRQTLDDASEDAIAAMVGASTSHPEGLFFPDTYLFPVGTSDIDILRRAYRAQQHELDAIWRQRDTDLPLGSPYEALILASIVEKETGSNSDRPRIASVFVNRLRQGMPLQTDPSVIYGLGEQFDGDLRRSDLRADTPWNTYTRKGLPPTPISSPGRAALLAAVRPEHSKYLYFVARGDGSSVFAETLDAHNRNVARYQQQQSARAQAATLPLQP